MGEVYRALSPRLAWLLEMGVGEAVCRCDREHDGPLRAWTWETVED
jgi:hypothetical protein